MGNPFQFYKDEKEDHRLGLGKYAGEMKYVSAKTIPFVVGETLRARIERHPFIEYANEQCDNINLVEDGKGLFCNPCGHYHAIFTLKGVKRVYQHLPQKGYDTPEQTCLNPGKYRSDWTGNDECWEDPFPDIPDFTIVPKAPEPGEDFWAKLNKHMTVYHGGGK
jgi:hypothetical protein